jgi:hypothetical protein
MCETCKCSAYFNEELNDYACENNCACCNDANYVSDSDLLANALKELEIWKAYAGALEERVQVCGESYEDLEAEYFTNEENN